MAKLADLLRVFGRRTGPLVGVAPRVDLNRICAAIQYGCMGLPRELVDYITSMLRDDFRALTACSLTCKAMFASTRPFIHATLRLTRRNNERVLNHRERNELRRRTGHHEFRFLSYMGEHGFFRYTRHVEIRDPTLTLDNLQSHLHHLQSLNQIHTLTLWFYDAVEGPNRYKPCFTHFYSTLTSLALICPSGAYRALMQFALQFPKLENLSIEWSRVRGMVGPAVAIVDQSPPLCGHLRLVGHDTTACWPRSVDLAYWLPFGFNFRSVELEVFSGDRVQQILQSCAHTLEDLAIVLDNHGHYQLEELRLVELTVLRRLTLRMTFTQVSTFIPNTLQTALAITPPLFRKLVLEIDGLPCPSEHWGHWGGTDYFLERRFAKHGDFRLIIRTSVLDDPETFQEHVKGAFPLLTRRGCVHFVMSYSIGKSLPTP